MRRMCENFWRKARGSFRRAWVADWDIPFPPLCIAYKNLVRISWRPVKPAKRPVKRGSRGLIELSLVAAASNCGTSEITLRRKFGVHGIQPNRNGKYLIRDLLTAFGPNGDSASERNLASHADLQRDRAELTLGGDCRTKERPGAP
jgi:hypothetical protein